MVQSAGSLLRLHSRPSCTAATGNMKRTVLLTVVLILALLAIFVDGHIFSNPAKRLTVYIPKIRYGRPQQWISGGMGLFCARSNRVSSTRLHHKNVNLFLKRADQSFSAFRKAVPLPITTVTMEPQKKLKPRPLTLQLWYTYVKGRLNAAGDVAKGSDRYAQPEEGQMSVKALVPSPEKFEDADFLYSKAHTKNVPFNTDNDADLDMIEAIMDCGHYFSEQDVEGGRNGDRLANVLLFKVQLPEFKSPVPGKAARYKLIVRFRGSYNVLSFGRRLAVVNRAIVEEDERYLRYPFKIYANTKEDESEKSNFYKVFGKPKTEADYRDKEARENEKRFYRIKQKETREQKKKEQEEKNQQQKQSKLNDLEEKRRRRKEAEEREKLETML